MDMEEYDAMILQGRKNNFLNTLLGSWLRALCNKKIKRRKKAILITYIVLTGAPQIYESQNAAV